MSAIKFMSAEGDQEFLNRVMKGNVDAVKIANALSVIVHVWDNLIDKDVPVSDEEVNRMMWHALVTLPCNPFYKDVSGLLAPLIQMGVWNWHIANTMEKTPGRAREIAHVARYSIGDVMLYLAGLVGGSDWVREIGPELKMRIQRNDFASYDAEMTRRHGGTA